MSPKVKNKSFPPVKVTEEFLEETKKLAEFADEYLSDYIRKAVESRNNLTKIDVHFAADSTHKNNTASKPIETTIYTGPVEYISVEPVITQKQPKSTMVKSLQKDGKWYGSIHCLSYASWC